MLRFAHMDVTVTYTQRSGHAYEIVGKELKPGDYETIISISGDGLIHEIVNGLCRRKDWLSAFKDKITIGVIPGGTANGLVKSVLSHTDENYGIQEATFLVIKGRRVYMGVTEIDAEYEKEKVYSFLSCSWTIIADCDINSEVIRCIGNPRFVLYGIMRCIFLRKYLGTLHMNGFPVLNKNDNIDATKRNFQRY
jgi:sphingosine kinase